MKSRTRDRQNASEYSTDRASTRGRSQRRSQSSEKSSLLKILQLLTIATTGGAVMMGSLALFAFLRSGGQFFTDVKEALTIKPPEEKEDVSV
ncbi:MAG: hypothetical protein AAGL17_09540 [Cyanobacteria bacterium J06576_12]